MERVCRLIIENTIAGKISEKEAYEAIKALRSGREKPEEIAIIGVAVNLPLAENKEEFWSIIRNKVDCVRDIPLNRRIDSDNILRAKNVDTNSVEYAKLAYLDEVDKFDSGFFRISPKEAGLMDPNQRLFLQTAWSAVEDAGYGGSKLAGTSTGMYLGYGGESEYGRLIMEVEPEAFSIAVTGNLPSVIASRISYILDLKGPGIVINTACSSSLTAVHYACQGIRSGDCDMAVAGGVKINLIPVLSSQKIGIESSDARTKAFDDSSDGTGGGEGSVAVLLKPLKKALKDGDAIYAVIKGSSVNQDGNSNGITAPSPMAQAEVIKAAWKNAGVDPETIAYIEAHGTGTKLGDPIEVDGIQKAFREFTMKSQICAISSVKSNMGHLDSAAGILGLVKAVLALKNREIPPSIHFNKPNRAIDFIDSPVYVNDRTVKWEKDKFPRRCGVSSFGLSGTNCHVVLEEAPEPVKNEMPVAGGLNVLTISAKAREPFDELIGLYREKYVKGINGQDLRNLCYTLNTGRGHYNLRAAIVMEPGESPVEKLEKVYTAGNVKDRKSGIFYGEHNVSVSDGNSKISEAEKGVYSKKASMKVTGFINTGKQDRELLYDICALYVKGADVEWDKIYMGEKNSRVNAPAYPFLKQRSWIDLSAFAEKEGGSAEDSFYYSLSWEKKALKVKSINLLYKNVLVFADKEGFFSDFISMLENGTKSMIKVFRGRKFKKVDEYNYIISGSQDDYEKLCRSIKQLEVNIVVHLSSVLQNKGMSSLQDLYKSQNTGVLSLLHFIKAVQSDLKNQLEIVLISDNAGEVTGGESSIKPENAILFGLGKTIGMENPDIFCRAVDIDENVDYEKLFEELESGEKDYQVAYRNGTRYVEVVKKVDAGSLNKTEIKIKPNGVYIITGGTGRLGMEAGKYLASSGKVNLALINRSSLPDENTWDEIIEQQRNDKVSYIIKSINELRERGTSVECCCTDITSEEELGTLLAELRSKYGRINGIIHCAAVGVGRSGMLLSEETEESFREVLLPKVEGTWLLDKLTMDDRMDFFILYSSAITISGGLGTGSYIAANSYLDSYALMRNKTGRKTLAINWPVLENKDLKGNMNERKLMFKVLPIDSAMASLNEILCKNISRVVIGELNAGSDIFSMEDRLPFRLGDELKASIPKARLYKDTESASKCDNAYEEPRDETERIIAELCRKVLGFERVGIHDDFFELGGHSLLAADFISKLGKAFEKSITLQCLFESPTVAMLAEIFREKTEGTEGEYEVKAGESGNIFFETVPKVGDKEYYPLSAAQRRMFVLNRIDTDSTAYNLTQVMQINGHFDRELLLNIFRELAYRHESMRTSFKIVDGQPVQEIHKDVEVDAGYVETEGDEDRISDIIARFIRPYDLSRHPLFRINVLKLVTPSAPLFFLIFDMHHIISDGISIAILIKEINELYAGKKLPESKIRYRDYAAWQAKLLDSDILLYQKEYWMKQLEGEIPVLNLPVDYPRPQKFSFKGDSIYYQLGREITDKLYSLARRNKVTLFTVLLAAYYTLLLKYTGQNDIIIGTSTAGRRNEDVNEIVGIFINTIALRNHPENEKGFDEFLREVGANTLAAFDNQDYPFELMVEKLNVKRDMSRNPVFDAMFILQNMDIGDINAEGLNISYFDYKKKIAQFDITITAVENKEGIAIEVNYCTSLFTRRTAGRIGSHFIRILECAVENPRVKLGEIEMLMAEEKNCILHQFNNTYAKYRHEESVNRLIEEQVRENPDRTAVVFKDRQLTYNELNIRANRLAWTLVESGVKADSIVSLMVDRSLDMIVGILAVLKAGGAYLPIDPGYPPDRINYMLKDSGAKIFLTQSHLHERLSDGKGAGDGSALPYLELLDLDVENTFDSRRENPGISINSSNLAYVIYTSGTTGRPKGVMIEHKSVVNFIKGITDRIGFNVEKTILALTTVSFDIFVLETLLPLSKGARIVIADESQQRDSKLLNDVIEVNDVNMLQITPSRLQLLLKGVNSLSCMEKLKEIMVGGEAFPQNLLEELKKITKARIYNMYGPTETTVWSTAGELTGSDAVDIGVPIANTRIYILDGNNHLMPPGIPGELYIAGDGLARGYINTPELTGKKFIPDPFFEGEKMYKTGDLARWLPDGRLECMGRMDQQVKIRGYRIEPDEIEKNFCNFEGIKECAVVARTDEAGNKFLVLYYAAEEEVPVSELRSRLAESLPEYMIPEIFIYMEQLPATPNGKIDRKALPQPDYSRPKLLSEYKCAGTETERVLVGIWQDILRHDHIGIEDSFFELGGNSLLLVKMHAELDRFYPGRVSVSDIFAHPNIYKLAQMIGGDVKSNIRDMDIIQLKLPGDYFTGSEADNESVGLRFMLDADICRELTYISAGMGIKTEDILFGVFTYVLSEISGVQEVPLHVLDGSGRVLPVKFELEGLKDIGELLLSAAQMRKSRSETNTFPIRSLRNIKPKKQVESVVVLFSYNFKEIHNDDMSYYDISLGIDTEKSGISCTLEYDSTRIRKEKLEEIIHYFIDATEAVVHAFGGVNHGKAN